MIYFKCANFNLSSSIDNHLVKKMVNIFWPIYLNVSKIEINDWQWPPLLKFYRKKIQLKKFPQLFSILNIRIIWVFWNNLTRQGFETNKAIFFESPLNLSHFVS